jgi:D,D-heptose 1,7-bisphosphate phosphatase
MKQAVILAGGKGTRLRSVMGDRPKPLAEVGGDTLLGHQLELLRRHGVEEALILVSYGADQIADWLKSCDFSPVKIRLIDDGEPRGTAGAVLAAFDDLADEFAVLYADTMVGIDLTRFWAFHASRADTSASLFLHPNDHPADSDLVEMDAEGSILRFHSYPHPDGAWLPNLVNAALYIVKREALRPWKAVEQPLDFAKQLFPAMLEAGHLLRGYNSPEYIKDAGTPARLDKVRLAFDTGVIGRASLSVPQKAVFIDRDGTLNVDKGFIRKAEDLELIEGVGSALHRLNESEWRSVIITNQPVLARGEASEEDLRRIHARLDTEVAKDHAFFDRLYYCPHHPDKGFPGEVAALKVDCTCRKPAPGMLLQAAQDLNIALSESWMVGDSTFDLGAAENAGVSAILVQTGNGGHDGRTAHEASFTQTDFSAAVSFILDSYPKLAAFCEPLLESFAQSPILFVGGLARSGKSTLSGALVREWRRKGQGAYVIALDRWIKDHDKRGPDVLGRYDLDAAEALLRQMLAFQASAEDSLTLTLPAYDRKTKTRSDKTLTLTLAKGDRLVIEGVPALEMARRLTLLASSLFVESDEETRRERFAAYDRLRGLSPEQSEAAYRLRQSDEHPLIRATALQAHLTVSLDSVL